MAARVQRLGVDEGIAFANVTTWECERPTVLDLNASVVDAVVVPPARREKS